MQLHVSVVVVPLAPTIASLIFTSKEQNVIMSRSGYFGDWVDSQ